MKEIAVLVLIFLTACSPGVGKDPESSAGDAGLFADTGTAPADAASAPVDAASAQTDAATPADAGSTSASCTTNSDCLAPLNTCLTDSGALCNGASGCACYDACDFNTPNLGCSLGERCGYIGFSAVSLGGVCFPIVRGAAHGQACQVSFSSAGEYLGDSCEIGNYCANATTASPTGVCVQFCNPAATASACSGLAENDCVEVASGVGFCLQVSSSTDIGDACASDSACNGGICAPLLGNSCTENCTSALFVCPDDAACITVDSAGTGLCIAACTIGSAGDATCAGKNTATVCEDIGVGFGLCLPKCTADTDCVSTCDLATGHCV